MNREREGASTPSQFLLENQMAKRVSECHPEREHKARGYCHACYNRLFMKAFRDEYNKRYQRENKEYWREYHRKHGGKRRGHRQSEATTTRLRNYRLTLNDYAKLLFEQGGLCKACRQLPDKRGYCIDHDHKCCSGAKSCGKCVRGLLCSSCNCMLGMAKDQIPTLLRLADYIREYELGLKPEEPKHEEEFYGS